MVANNTYLSVKINNWVFVHGGFCPEAFKGNQYLSKNPIHKLNTLMRKFLTNKYFYKDENILPEEKNQMKFLLMHYMELMKIKVL